MIHDRKVILRQCRFCKKEFKSRDIFCSKECRKKQTKLNHIRICKICGKKFRKLSNTHLLEKHNITTEEYKLQFENSLIVCEETKQFSVDTWNKGLAKPHFSVPKKMRCLS